MSTLSALFDMCPWALALMCLSNAKPDKVQGSNAAISTSGIWDKTDAIAVITGVCFLLVSAFVLLACSNHCVFKLKYSVSDEENQNFTISKDDSWQTSTFSRIPYQSKHYKTSEPTAVTSTLSAQPTVGLSNGDNARQAPTNTFKRVSIIAVPSTAEVDTTAKHGVHTKLFKRRHVRRHFTSGTPRHRRLRRLVKGNGDKSKDVQVRVPVIRPNTRHVTEQRVKVPPIHATLTDHGFHGYRLVAYKPHRKPIAITAVRHRPTRARGRRRKRRR